MGCTPSAQQSQSGTAQTNGDEGERNCDQNKNSRNCRITENHSKRKSGCGWRKKAEKIKASCQSSETDKMKLENGGEAEHGHLNAANKDKFKILLAFPKEDNLLDCFVQAAERLGYEHTSSHSIDAIMNSYVQTGHDIVVLDNRYVTQLDAVCLCRKMRHTKWGSKSMLVAVIKKSYVEESHYLPLISAGFNRCIVETFNVGMLMNELVGLEQSEMRPKVPNANHQAMSVALSKCKDLIQITDESFVIQYVNRATELSLGFRSEEVRGKSIWDVHNGAEYQNAITHHLIRGKEWEGSMTTRRKSGDPIASTCRVIGSSIQNRNINNFIFIQEAPTEGSATAVAKDQQIPRGSLHSIRKGSYDVKSLASESGQSLRRQSLAKLNSLPIEAPITKIITLLYSAHEQSSACVQQQLEKVVDILKSTELYSPQLKENRIRPDDPITTDLISALLSQSTLPVSTTRRSSNDSATVKSAGTRPSIPSINTPGQLLSVLEQSLDWEFDIFRLEELSNQRPLVWLGMNLLCHFSVPATLGCDEKTLMNWLTVVEMHYHGTNSYHNSTHAADVMQASSCYMKRERLYDLLDPLDVACILIAACCHDIDHPGKSSIFLCNSDHDLAILYNDQSVLESHHAAMTFKLTTADDRVNIFKGLERDTYKVARQSIIDMILATEMTRHFEHLTKFVNVFTKPEPKEDEPSGEGELSDLTLLQTRDNIALAKRMLIKCADVSNPTRPLKQCVEWARRIAEEYFNQTDEEKANGLPVVMPMFDRSTCSIPKSQMGFVDFIINDMMEAWDSFIELPEILYYLRSNYQYWKEKEEEGVTSITDLYPLNSKIDFLSEVEEPRED